jgi:hypothetical protein
MIGAAVWVGGVDVPAAVVGVDHRVIERPHIAGVTVWTFVGALQAHEGERDVGGCGVNAVGFEDLDLRVVAGGVTVGEVLVAAGVGSALRTRRRSCRC